MMEFLSKVSPKFAWIIAAAGLVVFAYAGINGKIRASRDAKTKKNGTNLKAKIVSIKFDEMQRKNNHLTAAMTVQYHFNGHDIVAKRGIAFPFIEKDKFVPGAEVDVRVDNITGVNFYYIDYQTY